MINLSLYSRLLGMLAVLVLPATAVAVPITYNFNGGVATVTATVLGTPIAAGAIALNGNFMIFDAAAPAITDLGITAAGQAPIGLTTPYAGYDQITIDSLLVGPGVGYTTLFGFGSNPYTVTVGPLLVSGVATITDSSATLPDVVGLPFGFETTSLQGVVVISGPGVDMLDFTGLTLGSIGPFGLETDPIILKGDIFFSGVVPEPTTGLLLGAAFGGCALMGRRRPCR